jgi:membrane protein implicated in regulation of membrane protease activity
MDERGGRLMLGNPKLLLWVTGGSAVIVGAILVLATGEWWTLLIPVAIHIVATTLVTKGVFDLLGERDKPDPVTQAHLDDEGKHPATS